LHGVPVGRPIAIDHITLKLGVALFEARIAGEGVDGAPGFGGRILSIGGKLIAKHLGVLPSGAVLTATIAASALTTWKSFSTSAGLGSPKYA